MLALTITISLWIIIPLSYIIWNLYNKNKKMEDIIANQRMVVKSFMFLSKGISELIAKIEMTMYVNSDPEIQTLFDKLKELKSVLDSYDENA